MRYNAREIKKRKPLNEAKDFKLPKIRVPYSKIKPYLNKSKMKRNRKTGTQKFEQRNTSTLESVFKEVTIDESMLNNIIQKGQKALIKKYGSKEQAIKAGQKFLKKHKKLANLLKKKYAPGIQSESIERIDEGLMDFFKKNKRIVFTALLFMTLIGIIPGQAFAETNDQVAREMNNMGSTGLEQMLDSDGDGNDPLQNAIGFLKRSGSKIINLGNDNYGIDYSGMSRIISRIGSENISDDDGVWAELEPAQQRLLGLLDRADTRGATDAWFSMADIQGAEISKNGDGVSISVGENRVNPDRFAVRADVLEDYGENLQSSQSSQSATRRNSNNRASTTTINVTMSIPAINAMIDHMGETSGWDDDTRQQLKNNLRDPANLQSFLQDTESTELYNQMLQLANR